MRGTSYYSGQRRDGDRYEPITLPTGKIYGPVLYTCKECGSVVHNMARHDKWHTDQGRPHETGE